MVFSRSMKRFAHLNGFTFVGYSEDGDKILSCGSDGDVRIWSDIGDDDPISQCIGEFGLCLAQFDNRILVSTDTFTVQAYKFPEFDKDGIEFRFTGPVTSIAYNKKYFACGSEDCDIKVQLRDKSEDLFELKGKHTGPILHVDLSPKNLLVSTSGDGTVKIWDLEKKDVIKSFDGFPKVNTFNGNRYFTTACFEPQFGRYLAYAKERQVYVLETTNWTTKFTLRNELVPGEYTVCSFSPCGEYIAAGGDKGEISVWNLNKNCLVDGEFKGEDEFSITSMAWNPKKNGEIAFCDEDGQLSSVTDCYEKTAEMANGKKSSAKKVQEDDVENDPDDFYGGIDFHGEDEDEDDENVVSLEKIKNETLKMNGIADSDDETDKGTDRPSSRMSETTDRDTKVMKTVKLQPAFQPGSTPIHLEHRFMVWNHVGLVLSHHSDTENSVIVEFHDVNVHPSLHMTNHYNHQMSSLSSTCLALATKESPCKLVCIALGASGSKEWSVTLPDCEEIEAVAASETFVAIATDARFVRFFTVMGTQREVISIPGPVVAMSGFDDKLLVAYHNSKVENDISLMLIHSLGFTLLNRDMKLPLSDESRLNWLGFSDVGSPVSYDSLGILRMYNLRRNVWYPICDTNLHTKGASDNFFIISVSEKDQTIRSVLCRGTSYPLTNPRPFVNELKFDLPLCDLETDKSKLEEVLIRCINFGMDSARKNLLEKALKLFSAALNSEMESRAYELIEIIADPQLIELSAKYANQRGRIHMAEKILKLLAESEAKEKEKIEAIKQFEKEAETYSNVYETPTSRKAESSVDSQDSCTPIIAPKPIVSQKNRNPFKKSTSNKSTPTNPLTHLTNKSIGFGNESRIESPNPTNAESDDENTPVNVSNKSTNRSVSQDTPRPGNFMAWFVANKEDLKLSNPLASDADLTKMGMKMYKDLTKHQKMPGYEDDPKADHQLSSKRKLDLKDDTGSVSSKLAKYMLNKD